MIAWLKRGRVAVAAIALAIMCFGFATPAMAEGESTYDPSDAKLTAVIVAPIGTDASGDTYVFHFAGGGTVEAGQQEESGKIPVYSDGVEQDGTTIKNGDVVPTIGDEDGNVTLTGIKLTDANSLTNGDLGQTVVQMPLSEILSNITFPHAGVYTYEVTQTSATSIPSKAYVARSQAKYRLRIWVKNANTGSSSLSNNMDLAIDYVTVERLKNDDGNEEKDAEGKPVYNKVDPTSPKTDDNGRIDITRSGTNPLAGDESGHNVPGFTFANEYFTSGPFQVKKLYDGDHSDRTRYSTVELAVHCSESPNASGGALTYTIEGGGKDTTENSVAYGQQGSKVQFNDNGWCYIKAELKEGSSIRITGELDSSGETLSTNGLFRGQAYYVLENNPYDYRPTGYVYVGENQNADPRKDYRENDGLWYKQNNVDNDPYDSVELPDGTTKDLSIYALLIESSIESSATGKSLNATGRNTTGNDTVFVVNSLDEAKVSPTGILIDNLPYILMIGIPVIVFIALFVLRRRRNAFE